MYFFVTIDTEEDNWDNFQDKPSFKNLKMLKKLQNFFNNLDVKPTYLITYQVANNMESVEILKEIINDNSCELGTHLHPWNTPPINEKISSQNTMLNNLNSELQFEKLKNLHEKIIENLNIIPRSFRAGRYGFNMTLAKNLIKLNYDIDSSITPFLDWSKFYGPNFSMIHQLDPFILISNENSKDLSSYKIIEVPLTVGYTQKNFNLINKIYNILKKKPIKYFKIIGILSKLHMMNKVRLTPEGYNFSEIKNLLDNLKRKEVKFYNISFHSNSLLPGCTPFVNSKNELNDFFKRLENIIIYLKNMKFNSILLSEVKNHF